MKKIIKSNSIMIHKLLTALADNLIKVFLPLIILKDCGSLFLCVMFLVFYSLFTALLNYAMINTLKTKPLTMILLHIIPYCIMQFSISLYPVYNLFMIMVYALLNALGQTFYSVPSNNYFMFENKGSNAGKMQIGSNIGKIFMILIGGYIISKSTIEYILMICLVATIFYILSIYPLFYIKENYNISNIYNILVLVSIKCLNKNSLLISLRFD